MGQLANLANSLPPGQAAKLTTQNLIPAFSQSVGIPGGATGSITPFSENMCWDHTGNTLDIGLADLRVDVWRYG